MSTIDLTDLSVNTDLKGLFTHPEWQRLPREPDQVNWIYYNRRTRVAAIVSQRSERGSFALSVRALTRASNALREGKVREVYVVLKERAQFYILDSRSLKAVHSTFDGQTPVDGPFGPHWWMDENFAPDGLPF